jgi:hypothetical protein
MQWRDVEVNDVEFSRALDDLFDEQQVMGERVSTFGQAQRFRYWRDERGLGL